ncbi:MAG: TatD family hydrolase [Natronomonas sp.]
MQPSTETAGRAMTEPTARDIGLSPAATDPPEPIDLPLVDLHQHTQSLTWNDREKFDLAGYEAAVMIAAGYYWSPYRPVAADDVRFLWDDAIRRARAFTHRHFYDQYVAVAVHTWSRVSDADELVAALPEYCDLEEVVAIGETGIESTQHTTEWPLDEQKAIVREQFHVARETDLPVLLHTPGSSKGDVDPRESHSYEEGNRNFTDPVLRTDTTKADAVEIDLALAEEVGLDDEQIVVDHAGEPIVDRVLGETDCWLAYSVSAPWLRGIDARDVKRAIDQYGSDRIVVDTDLIGAMRNDSFVLKRTAMDLLRLGVDRDAVRDVVYENPKQVLGI